LIFFLTVRTFSAEVVVLADELIVVEDVEFFAGAQLFSTYKTRETVQVEHFVPRFSN
jgi:hypothetical protein